MSGWLSLAGRPEEKVVSSHFLVPFLPEAVAFSLFWGLGVLVLFGENPFGDFGSEEDEVNCPSYDWTGE